jgi:hypothetical protein
VQREVRDRGAARRAIAATEVANGDEGDRGDCGDRRNR